jgi:hypothetical protein
MSRQQNGNIVLMQIAGAFALGSVTAQEFIAWQVDVKANMFGEEVTSACKWMDKTGYGSGSDYFLPLSN